MKLPQKRQSHNLLLILLGPFLIICIIISGSYIVSTYKSVAHSKQKTLWSVVQLDRELTHTQTKVNDYIHDLSTAKSLEMAYNILWSRLPIALNSIQEDLSLSEPENNEICLLVDDLFDDVKRVESIIVGQTKISKIKLEAWSRKLKQHEDAIRGNLIHDLASSNSPYARQTTTIIFKAATIPLFFVICFFLYLAYLLSALWNERKINQQMLDHDTMTGLHSRDFIMNRLDKLCASSSPFILLAFDLNKLKTVNDTLGHNAGDKLLQHFALQLKNTLGKKGVAGRVGGDEFLWVCQSTDVKLINDYYGQFLLAMKQPCFIDGHNIKASASTGGILSTNCDHHMICILEQADLAMYEAKRRQLKTIFWCTQEKELNVKAPNPIEVPLPARMN